MLILCETGYIKGAARWCGCRGAIHRTREEDFKHGRPMGRPYTFTILRVTENDHAIMHTYQHAAPLQSRF
jgi:hypothetical protein